jgi:hypothetical protein
MEKNMKVEGELMDSHDGAATARAPYRVSEPNEDGNRFLIMLGADGREKPPAADDAGPFAREGA